MTQRNEHAALDLQKKDAVSILEYLRATPGETPTAKDLSGLLGIPAQRVWPALVQLESNGTAVYRKNTTPGHWAAVTHPGGAQR